jgi:hypothetical protein
MSRPAKTLSIVLRRTAAFCAIVICAAFAQNENFGDKSLHSDEKNAILISVVESSEKLHESLQGKPSLSDFALEDYSYDDLPTGETIRI